MLKFVKEVRKSVDKSKVMVSVGEEGFECEIRVDKARLEQCQSSSIWCVLWINQVYMLPGVVGR